MSIKSGKIKDIINSKEFKALVRKRLLVSISMTIIMLAVYFGFILIIAFDKQLLATKIGEHLTIGLPIGIGIIIFAWIFTGVYIRWANSSYDKSVKELRNQIINQ